MPPKMLKDEQLGKYLLLKEQDPDSVLTKREKKLWCLRWVSIGGRLDMTLSFHLGAIWPFLSSTGGWIPSEITDR